MKISPQSDFWRFLRDAGVISEPTADGMEQQVRDRWMPLGRILLRERKITPDQMKTILRLQGVEPGMRVGDLAVREGYCDQEAVDAAIAFQRDGCPHPLSVLMEDEEVDRDALLASLYGYVRHLEGRVQVLDALFNESQAQEAAND
jgi:hypothetical protein